MLTMYLLPNRTFHVTLCLIFPFLEMNANERILISNSDLGLVNIHHSETSADRTLVRREKLANEFLSGAINDFLQALATQSFTPIGKKFFNNLYIDLYN